MRVLGIETSCDETGVALYDSERGIVAERLFSQIELHRAYGGVVPELASRDHIRRTLPLVQEVLAEAGVTGAGLDGVAYTAGPGLLGALLVGAMLGRSLALAWGVPAIGIHHMEGHLLAPMLEPDPPRMPLVALLVSGGHTQLVRVDGVGRYTLLGDTLDDAAGEAFDKTAKMLGLAYPGGPEVAALAERGDPARLALPRPMTTRAGLDFSFSGLKTAVLTATDRLRRADGTLAERDRADIAAAFQAAVVDTLVIKCRRALDATGLTELVIAGGVSANRALRTELAAMAAGRGARLRYARPALCTDNGAMIAYAGYRRLAAGMHDSTAVVVRARWPLASLAAVAEV